MPPYERVSREAVFTTSKKGSLTMPDVTQSGKDSRTNREVITQWKKLQEIKRALLKEGTVSGDATPADVLAAIRAQIPSDLLVI